MFKIHIVSIKEKCDLYDEFRDINCTIESLNVSNNLFNPIAFIRLFKILRRVQPDVVHTWMYHSDFFGGIVAKLLKVPVIIWSIRSADFFNKTTPILTRFLVKLCALTSKFIPDIILTNSSKGLDVHKSYGYDNSKLKIINNGVDLKKFKQSIKLKEKYKKKIGIQNNFPVIGLIGRFDELKNHSGFIEAAFKIKSKVPDANFIMAGDNVDYNNRYIMSLLNKYKLNDCFFLLGSQGDVENIIRLLDVLVISSSSEAFPNVMLEAFATEVHCISTDVGDAKKILGSCDWVVPVGDMQGIANKCCNFLMKSEIEKNKLKSFFLEKAKNYYSIEKMVIEYQDLYLTNFKSKI